jgi:hypothetical protein
VTYVQITCEAHIIFEHMNKTILLLLGFSIIPLTNWAQRDLEIGNVDIGYQSYDAESGLISGVYFDVLNNEDEIFNEFEISILLMDPDDNDTYYKIWSLIDENGQGSFSAVEYYDIDININNAETTVPDGEYRLVVCVDEPDDIFESNEDNNCIFVSSSDENLVYSSLDEASIIQTSSLTAAIYPNPTTGNFQLTLNEQLITKGQVHITDLSGKTLMSFEILNPSLSINLSQLVDGCYIYRIEDENAHVLLTGRVLKVN